METCCLVHVFCNFMLSESTLSDCPCLLLAQGYMEDLVKNVQRSFDTFHSRHLCLPQWGNFGVQDAKTFSRLYSHLPIARNFHLFRFSGRHIRHQLSLNDLLPSVDGSIRG